MFYKMCDRPVEEIGESNYYIEFVPDQGESYSNPGRYKWLVGKLNHLVYGLGIFGLSFS